MKDNASAFSSSEYDQEIKRTLPFYESFYEQVIDVVNVHFEMELTWLDIGCGTGKMAEVAFQKANIKKFTFCDNSDQMIEIARMRFQNKCAEFITAPIQELDINQKYNVITAIQVFHYLSQRDRLSVIKKCYGLLDTDGVFISFENFAPYTWTGKELFMKRWRHYQLSRGRSADDCDKHMSRYGKQYFPISISEHLKLLHQGGFHTAEILWVSNMQVGVIGIK